MAYTTIDLPTDYFNTVLYTGDGTAIGSGGQAITGVGFAPDWTWIKERSSTSPHKLLDTVRGATKELESNGTNAEATTAESLASFDSDGFTVGNNGAVNQSSQTYASWNWLAGGTASSNTDGSITSTVSANTTAGFSIVSYTGNGSAGATVGHGLGSAPAVMIFKITNTTDNWRVYHQGIDATAPEDYHVQLNSTGARVDNAGFFNDTAPTSSVFTLGSDSGINGSSNTFIAYCFAEKKGYSKFGSYTGNGNADGTFIYTGFRVGWVMIKRTDGANGWYIYDSTRDPENQNTKALLPAESDAEQDESGMDLLSNGFKLRNTDGSKNGSGNSYIYMAFAESPFVTSTGIPTTAR